MPERIQLSRAKGWRLPPNTVRVTRPGPWGNPFNFRDAAYCWVAVAYGCRADPAGRQEASVRAYREWIAPGAGLQTKSMSRRVTLRCEGMPDGEEIVMGKPAEAGEAPPLDRIRAELRGKNLACWCKPGTPCHADVLLELANA